jgi:ubiquinone biosynthesis protein
LLSLLRRALVLLGLIVEAASLYLRSLAVGRWPALPLGVTPERWNRFALRFVRIATRFRGALIKLGQVASLRVEVLPDSITDELSKLQDRVEPHSPQEIAAQIEAELGAPPSELFAEFEPEAIAAASLGQVHRAVSKDGDELAIKVLYPGIERSVAVDVAMAHFAMWLFNFLVVPDLLRIHHEVRRNLEGEMDYRREARAAEEVGRNLAKDPELAERVRVPEIHWEWTRERVLAMEFIPGVKINELGPDGHPETTRDELVLWASRAFLHMMFRDGFFHCDPHPGNLIVDPDGRLAIIDFGMNERLDPEVLRGLRKNMLATVQRDAEAYARSLLEIGAIDERDLPAIIEIAELQFDPAYFNLTPQEMANVDVIELMGNMRGHMQRIHKLRLPTGFVMFSRAISILYGLVVELAPGLRPLDVFGPYVMRFLAGDIPFEKKPDRGA